MTCTPIDIPGVGRGFICGPRAKRKRCSGCGRPADLLCDWKVPGGTCDKPICASCTTSPAKDKDLCPEHAAAFERWKAKR
jgi:hypothetical protein